MSKLRVIALSTGIALGLAVSLFAGGCARHAHHHAPPPAKQVVVLDHEHEDRTIVVVHDRPGPDRHCWKHKTHWHCRAH